MAWVDRFDKDDAGRPIIDDRSASEENRTPEGRRGLDELGIMEGVVVDSDGNVDSMSFGRDFLQDNNDDDRKANEIAARKAFERATSRGMSEAVARKLYLDPPYPDDYF